MQGLVYILVNKTSFSLSTIKLTNNFICEVGHILVLYPQTKGVKQKYSQFISH